MAIAKVLRGLNITGDMRMGRRRWKQGHLEIEVKGLVLALNMNGLSNSISMVYEALKSGRKIVGELKNALILSFRD